jgi:hypothetical protein
MKRFVLGCFALGATSVAFAQTTVYTDVNLFKAAAGQDLYCEAFANVPTGAIPIGGLNFGPVNGYSYNVDAAAQLYNATGLISTNQSFDPIIVTFNGAPVSAVGGNFWVTDINFLTIPGEIMLNLSNGFSELYPVDNLNVFRGFTTDAPITSIEVHVASVLPPELQGWSTMDNLCVGVKGGGSQCKWDLNGDGKVCQEDLGQLLAGFGTLYTQADLGGLLAEYGTCGGPCL